MTALPGGHLRDVLALSLAEGGNKCNREGDMAFLFSLIIGLNGQIAPSPQPEPEPIKQEPVTQTYEVTAYTAHCPGCSGIAANGERPVKGVTIACPPSMKLGTWLWIESVGRRRCDDRGGAIKGKRLDLFIPDLGQALKFGRRDLAVKILKE